MTREEIKSRLAELEDMDIIFGVFTFPVKDGKIEVFANSIAGMRKKGNKFYLYYPEIYASTMKPMLKEICKTLNLCPLRVRLGMKLKLSYLEAITFLENITPFLNKYTSRDFRRDSPVFMTTNSEEALEVRRKEQLPYKIAELGEEIYDTEQAYKTLSSKKAQLKKLREEYLPIAQEELQKEINKADGKESSIRTIE